MTSNELAQNIKEVSSALHKMIETKYQSTLPHSIEKDLIKQKCIALYELLLIENTTIDKEPISVENTQEKNHPVEIEKLAMEQHIPILTNDIPMVNFPIETTPIHHLPTPTEQLNLEIDAILDTQTPSVEPTPILPQEEVNEISLHEKIASSLPPQPALADKLTSIPSLKNAINVNLKIAIVNQLFNENTVEYVKAIDKLNTSENIHEALRYFTELKHTYDWENDNSLVKDLEQLIQKRFA